MRCNILRGQAIQQLVPR